MKINEHMFEKVLINISPKRDIDKVLFIKETLLNFDLDFSYIEGNIELFRELDIDVWNMITFKYELPEGFIEQNLDKFNPIYLTATQKLSSSLFIKLNNVFEDDVKSFNTYKNNLEELRKSPVYKKYNSENLLFKYKGKHNKLLEYINIFNNTLNKKFSINYYEETHSPEFFDKFGSYFEKNDLLLFNLANFKVSEEVIDYFWDEIIEEADYYRFKHTALPEKYLKKYCKEHKQDHTIREFICEMDYDRYLYSEEFTEYLYFEHCLYNQIVYSQKVTEKILLHYLHDFNEYSYLKFFKELPIINKNNSKDFVDEFSKTYQALRLLQGD